jgi:hypothetical protein
MRGLAVFQVRADRAGLAVKGWLCIAAVLAAGPALAQEYNQVHFASTMNSVFGAGNWRQTGGYRTPERENQLRAEGAMTTAPGVLSRHSLGRRDAPGAYDLVVNGLSPWEAAARLRAAGVGYRRLMPKGAHGTQGPHLHFEPLGPWGAGRSAMAGRRPGLQWTVAAPTAAEAAVTRLREAAVEGDHAAQLELARMYELGVGAHRDPIAAYVWASAASASAVTAEERTAAQARLSRLATQMSAADLTRAQRFARASAADACAAPSNEVESVVILLTQSDVAPNPAQCGAG